MIKSDKTRSVSYITQALTLGNRNLGFESQTAQLMRGSRSFFRGGPNLTTFFLGDEGR